MANSSLVTNVEVTVFLVSLKAGGVALNLTEASRVYLMDSWWNPAVSHLRMTFGVTLIDHSVLRWSSVGVWLHTA